MITENQKKVLQVFARTGSATKDNIRKQAGCRFWFPALQALMHQGLIHEITGNLYLTNDGAAAMTILDNNIPPE